MVDKIIDITKIMPWINLVRKTIKSKAYYIDPYNHPSIIGLGCEMDNIFDIGYLTYMDPDLSRNLLEYIDRDMKLTIGMEPIVIKATFIDAIMKEYDSQISIQPYTRIKLSLVTGLAYVNDMIVDTGDDKMNIFTRYILPSQLFQYKLTDHIYSAFDSLYTARPVTNGFIDISHDIIINQMKQMKSADGGLYIRFADICPELPRYYGWITKNMLPVKKSSYIAFSLYELSMRTPYPLVYGLYRIDNGKTKVSCNKMDTVFDVLVLYTQLPH